MAEARSRERWAHTSALLALTANCHRDPRKSKAFTPADFLPHGADKRTSTVKTKDLEILRRVFVREQER